LCFVLLSVQAISKIKTSKPAQYPLTILADTAVLAGAPLYLCHAGIGDMLGKYTALADWALSHELTGEYYGNPRCSKKGWGILPMAQRSAWPHTHYIEPVRIQESLPASRHRGPFGR
jgi:glycerol dehydrogenase-like iron-containing ADH family enzyme